MAFLGILEIMKVLVQNPVKNLANKLRQKYTVCSFQYSDVFAAFLLVFLGVFCLCAACVFFVGFVWFSLSLLFFVIFSCVPGEQPVGVQGCEQQEEKGRKSMVCPCVRRHQTHLGQNDAGVISILRVLSI